MRFDLDNAFGIHQQALLLRSKRAEILASNIANADTPNYQARDIDFKALLNNAKNRVSSLTTTHPNHIGGTNSASGVSFDLKYRQPLQPSLDGNSVDAEFEKSEFTRNALEFQMSLSFLNGKIKDLKRALSGE